MSDERAARMALVARACHVLDIGVLVGLVVAVTAFDKPRWLLFLVLPTALLSMAVQLLAFRAEADADDVRTWRANRERWEREHNQGS